MRATGSIPTGERPNVRSDGGFGVGDIFRVAGDRIGLIAAVTAAVVALTFVALMLLPTLYASSAVVMLDTRKNNVADLSSVLSELPTDSASLQNQIQILTSRDLAAKVIVRLKLYDDPEFFAGPVGGLMTNFRAALDPAAPAAVSDSAAAALDGVIDKFLRRLNVQTQGFSTTIAVSFTSESPDKAARIANAIVDTYIEDQLTTKFEANRKTTEWLMGRVSQLAQQVQAAEAATQRYKAEHNLDQTSDGSSLVDQQMAGISAQIVAARADLAQKQANYNRVASLVGSGHAADASQVVASPLIVQLRTQEADLIRQESDFATKYGPKHPKMIAAEQQKRDLETKINEEVTRIAGAMQNDVAVAHAQLGSLEGSLKGTEKQAGTQNFARVKLKELEGNAASTRTMYDTFVSRLRQFQDQDAIQNSDARVISRASIPMAPTSPKRTLILGASVPAGLLLGLLLALLLEYAGAMAPARARAPRRVRQPIEEALRPFSGAPVLAQIPNVTDARAADYVIDYPMSAFSQAMDRVAARLANQNTRVIAVTSAQHGEGKTAIAVALARAAARRGMRTILIDADLRAPRAAQAMGISGVQAGLYEATSGSQPLSRCLYKDPRSNVLLLSTPRPLREPHMVLGSPAMARLVAHLSNTADLVIVDTAPALASEDTPMSSKLADGILMVVRQPRPEVTGAIDAMQQTGAPPIGVLLAV